MAKRGRKPKYPWDTWLTKGTVTDLKQGRDFNGYTKSFIYNIYRAAANRKVKVNIAQLSNERLTLTCLG